jgi:ketosteroid isomerase-like protein
MTNRELVEGMFAALQRGDFDGAFALAVPDVEFDNRTEAPGAAGVWQGRDGFLAMMRNVTDAFSEYSVELVDSREHRDAVTLRLRECSRGHASGVAGERELFLTYTVRDGTIVRMLAALEPPEGAIY